MKPESTRKASGLTMRNIFRAMMEDGYYPTFEQTHIQFGIEDNIAVLEYEENILSIRLFFSIEEEAYELFLEASNLTMTETYAVKPAILDDMKNIMFSCEIMCDTLSEFRKFLPRAIEYINTALQVHKSEMQTLVLASEVAFATIPAKEDTLTGINRKILS